MAITYPLALPSLRFARVTLRAVSGVAVSESPFTGAQQVYAQPRELWAADLSLPPMDRADAEAWVAWFLALNGREGTFLLGDPRNVSPRGTWAGSSPLVNGAGQTGKTLAIDGLSAGATVKAGDWFQLGSGASSRLHKVAQDATANGAGQVTLDLWPRLRASPADNAALTLASPQGVFRLSANDTAWSLEPGALYAGFNFSAGEAL